MSHFILAALRGEQNVTSAMEMHDSVLKELVCESDGRGYALFRAVVYFSDGRVFEDPQKSGWQDLRFDFEGMRMEGQIPDFLDQHYASDGELWVNGKNENGVISLPVDEAGELCLEMHLNPTFDTLRVHASRIVSVLQGTFELETYWDADGKATRADHK